MLPDYPKAKALIVKRHFAQFGRTYSQVLGGLGEIPQAHSHEGHRFGLIREDGKLDEIKWKKLEVSRTVKVDELQKWNEEQVYAHYASMAAEFAYKQKQATLDEIVKATEDIDNTITGGITPETILKLYDSITLDFQENGQPVKLCFSGSSDACASFRLVLEQIETDPVLRKQLEEILEIKRNQWREREGNRKLVG